MSKMCYDCKQSKSLDMYYKSNTTYCKICMNERTRLQQRKRRGICTVGHISQLGKYWPDLNQSALERKYTTLFEDQNGVCAVCLETEPSGRRLAVDHCHTTGKVRGLLCVRCNTGIVKALDKQSHLVEAAQNYLKQA